MADREARLEAIRDEAARLGVDGPSGSGYYDRPLLKPPVWTWEVPAYFFVGGVTGVAAMIAVVARAAGASAIDATLVRDARSIAAAGALLSAVLLIADLGRPARFIYMLRVFKWRSPMSVGAWTLALFSPAVMLPVALSLTGIDSSRGLPFWTIAAADAVALVTGLVLATYTGVLIGATAIPVWAAHARLLPLHFGASSLGAAASALELCGHRLPSLNRLAIAAALTETLIGVLLEWRRDQPASALGRGASAVATRLGDLLSGPVPLALRLASGMWPAGRMVAAVSAIAGSVFTRYGWIEAGRRSANQR